MRAGIDRFGFAEREAVERSQRELRLEPALATEILDSVARRAFLAFISRSRTKPNRLDAAKELKALVFFSNIVVAPLLEDLKVRCCPLLCAATRRLFYIAACLTAALCFYCTLKHAAIFAVTMQIVVGSGKWVYCAMSMRRYIGPAILSLNVAGLIC